MKTIPAKFPSKMDVAAGLPCHRHNILPRCCFREVADVDVKQHRCEDGTLRDTILPTSEPPALSVAGVLYGAPVCKLLHDETHTVLKSGMVLSSLWWSQRCHMLSYADVRSINTIPAFSLSESFLRSLVSVVLLGPPLIYHGGSRLVPEEAVGPPLGRCGFVSTSTKSRTGTQSSEMGLYDVGSLAGLFGFEPL